MGPARTQPATAQAAVHEARLAVTRGDLATAVAQLVLAWAELPSPRIAAVASQLSARLPMPDFPSKLVQREEVWLAVAARHDPALLPSLLAVDWPAHPRVARARLARLVEFPPDPRIAHAVHELWAMKRYRSVGDEFWHAAFAALARWRDPTVTEIVRAGRAGPVPPRWGLFGPRLALDLANLPAAPVLDAVEDDLAQLEAALAPRTATTAATRHELLEAVYDDPDADEPRAVLADALLADGDPRGELIQLQLARRGTGRIKALLRASAARWLDGLDGLVEHTVFRRGFVAELAVDGGCARLEPGRRAWRTVESLRLCQLCDTIDHVRAVEALEHPNLAQVRRVDGLPGVALAAFTRPHAFDHLGVTMPLATIGPGAQLRARELSIIGSIDQLDMGRRYAPDPIATVLAWFAGSPLRASVESLVIDRFESDLPSAWRWFQGSSLRSLTLRPLTRLATVPEAAPMAWELVLARDPAGTGSVLEATWHGRLYGERPPDGLGAALAALPDGALTSLAVRSVPRIYGALQDGFVAEISEALHAQHRLARPRLFEDGLATAR
jgi:uncharacterized protein (TIGR02996 family)